MRYADAKRTNRKRYVGKMCEKHPALNGERFTSNSRCCGCLLEAANAWNKNNRERTRANGSRWRAQNPERRANQHYVKRYGITKAQKDAMLHRQGGVCACCQEPTRADWHVDHCHATNVVRGVLCSHCNWMLGNALESPVRLTRALTYLRRHTAVFTS